MPNFNPFTFWIDFWMNLLRGSKGRKGSHYGLPEPMDSTWNNVNEEIKKQIKEE